jgi:hypothetical protein
MPVEIESPDRHYYHVAFFTSRAMAAGEELTWVSEVMWSHMPCPMILCHFILIIQFVFAQLLTTFFLC